MPALSVKQRRLMAMAEHHPEEISSKNKGVLKMSKEELHKFASTKEKDLPMSRQQKVQKVKKHKNLYQLMSGK